MIYAIIPTVLFKIVYGILLYPTSKLSNYYLTYLIYHTKQKKKTQRDIQIALVTPLLFNCEPINI
jgi:hypothetical protein